MEATPPDRGSLRGSVTKFRQKQSIRPAAGPRLGPAIRLLDTPFINDLRTELDEVI
jgi:hypothetical protein